MAFKRPGVRTPLAPLFMAENQSFSAFFISSLFQSNQNESGLFIIWVADRPQEITRMHSYSQFSFSSSSICTFSLKHFSVSILFNYSASAFKCFYLSTMFSIRVFLLYFRFPFWISVGIGKRKSTNSFLFSTDGVMV